MAPWRGAVVPSSMRNAPLPKLIEMEKDLYYDSIHFDEAGAREVARVVAEFLVKNVYNRSEPKPTTN